MKLRYWAGYGTPFLAFYNKIRFLSAKNNAKGCLRILIYHNISENKLELFKQQIYYLASTYRFLTPPQFLDFVNGKYCLSGINLLITFDDGFKSNRIVADKILDPLGIKCIFFVSPEFIGLQDIHQQKEFITQQIFDGYTVDPESLPAMEPLMWEDLECLLDKGHVIGSHGRNHKRLSSRHSREELYDEVVESGNILEKHLKVPITFFAYPFGDIDSIDVHAMNLIKERYKYCFSGVRGANYYPVPDYAILRDSISIDDPPRYVRFVVENGLDIIYKKKARRLRELTFDPQITQIKQI